MRKEVKKNMLDSLLDYADGFNAQEIKEVVKEMYNVAEMLEERIDYLEYKRADVIDNILEGLQTEVDAKTCVKLFDHNKYNDGFSDFASDFEDYCSGKEAACEILAYAKLENPVNTANDIVVIFKDKHTNGAEWSYWNNETREEAIEFYEREKEKIHEKN